MSLSMEESEDHQLQQRKLSLKIAKVLDEARISQATHIRKLKELADLRSSRPPIEFFAPFSKAITPLFNFHRRTASADRIIKFVAVLACSRNAKDAARPRRRARDEEESSSNDELSPTSVASTNLAAMSTRSQRVSNTVALTRMTANRTRTIEEGCFDTEDSDEAAGSELTSEDDPELIS